MPLLTQNSELRPHLIWNWSIPALTAKLPDGRRISTCPSAGICARYCYARNGSYLFPATIAAHTRNLQLVLDDTEAWRVAMTVEVNGARFTKSRPPRTVPIPETRIADEWLLRWIRSGKPAVRIHDSGDFFADWYLREWLTIAETAPGILFYAYTKEIEMLRATATPDNFRWLASTGGTQDHLIGDDLRHADVFPSEDALAAAGYESQAANDLLAVLLPTNRVGITANNIRAYNKKIAGRTFSELQRSLRRD